ncbi:MAG: pentapeptide repeat-containing protein [Trichocoleus desertorum ATA4-8-CV12]|nr:pentapeptide repeat-containing protein [Trichocoleus desertorum ATA4-8-CV12]
MRAANLKGANLSGAELAEADFQQAIYDAATQFPLEFDPAAQGAYYEDELVSA